MRLKLNKILLSISALIAATASYAQSGFVENKGQWDNRIEYSAQIPSGRLFIEQNRFNFLFYDEETWNRWITLTHGRGEAQNINDKAEVDELIEQGLKMHTLLVNFKGSNIKQAPITPSLAQNTYNNYYLGNDPNHWATNVKIYDQLRYNELYRGIDLVYKNSSDGLKYDFVVKPGANPNNIQLEYEGAESLKIKRGYLVVETSVNTMLEEPPVAYQIVNGEKVIVNCEFKLRENIVSFNFKNGYDKSLPLVIDPILVFSTYSGSTVDNFGFTSTYDSEGNAYAGGISTSPTTIPNGRYPATAGAFDMTFNGGSSFFPCDITISKYNPDGSQLIYATYLGGENDDYPHSLVVDSDDNLLIFGVTESFFYPTSNNAYDKSMNGMTDIIVTKLTKDGDALIGSTYIGGSRDDGLNKDIVLKHFYSDDHRGDIIVDDNDFVFIASSTESLNFPAPAGVLQTDLKGTQDGVVAKFSQDLSTLIWATYLGGNSADALNSIDFDAAGNVVVAGGTRSNDYRTTTGAYQGTYQGGQADGMITVLTPNGDQLVNSTYVGTSQYDQIYSIEIDDAFYVYAVGQTDGTFPVKGNVYSNPNSGQFLIKFEPNLDKSLWSTVFGTGDGQPDITINAFLVDQCDKIYVSGWGGSVHGQNPPYSRTFNLPTTDNAYQKITDGHDFYFIVFSKEAEELIFASYFGGDETEDHVDGGTSRFDEKGIIYQSVCSSCPGRFQKGPLNDFPITQNSVFAKNVSPRCSNACIKYDFEAQNKPPTPRDTIVTVIATEELVLDYQVVDPNKEDTLYVDINGDIFGGGKLDPPYAQINTGKGLGPINSSIKWQTSCDHLTGDTIFLRVKAKDVGCPTSDSAYATIKILVTPPPATLPPDYFCLNFNSQGGVTLTFDSIETNKYFSHFEVYRNNPGSNIPRLIKTVTEEGAFTVVDNDVSSPETSNYCYYVVGVNICGEKVQSDYKICTQEEAEYPVDTSYVVTATVEHNKEIRVSWLSSTEVDFGSYQVYRLAKGKGDPENIKDYQYIGSTYSRFDTNFIDNNVNVQTTSYCYRLIVTDKCGHKSKPTNRGCTIVLKGVSTFLLHDLKWNAYEEWKGAIDKYTLYEHVDTGNYLPIVVNPNNELYHKDRTFDYDWGGYWYKVTAHEVGTADGGYGATSSSNEIYLIQKPILNVPNAFTPNNDFLNDSFETVDVFVREYNMKIFNRWGEKIFETDDKNEFWTGEYNNADPRNNAFVWICVYRGWDNRWHYVHGTVNILR